MNMVLISNHIQGIISHIHDKFALDFACLFGDFLLGSLYNKMQQNPAEIGFLAK